MALSKRNTWEYRAGNIQEKFVIAVATRIYDGALVGVTDSTGEATNWRNATASGQIFAGIAIISDAESADGTFPDSLIGNTANTVKVSVDVSGAVLEKVAVTNVSAVTHVGDRVYATDEDTLTLTATGGARPIGFVTQWYTGTTCDVKLFSMEGARIFDLTI